MATGHKNDHSIAVHGTRGSLAFSLERLNELRLCREGDRGYETVLVTDPSDPYVEAWWPPGHVLGWEHTFVHESYEFLAAVAGDGTFRPSFEDGLAVQRVLDAVERSDESGAWTSVA
jgi:predicted dehydrogenase